MRIACVGGGPAGLYFAIAAKLTDPAHEIAVYERDAAGSTYGWGVTFHDDLLDLLHQQDPVSARAVEAACVRWQEREVRLPTGRPARFGGYGHSLLRSALLEILTERAVGLGVRVHHQHSVDADTDLGAADLVVAADGVRSRLRQAAADHFGTMVTTGHNPYIWLGTTQKFASLTMAVADTPAGPIWFQAYPSTPEVSTCVVECPPSTWRGLGLDTAALPDALTILEEVFADGLGGQRLIGQSRGQTAGWLRFEHVTNDVWYHGKVVLIGDAAHTTHFSLASGTWLALRDCIVLTRALSRYPELSEALAQYDRRRRASLADMARRGLESMRWFENLPAHDGMDAATFANTILTRGIARPPPRWRVRLGQSDIVRACRRRVDERYRRRSARYRSRPD
ncbi:MAG TPA: FAD-dependent monooxygenase [Sporichthyaceae bacterium]|nr:FAD-dependent monooxygenase [Sporichthyaceae bacterium]